MNSTSKKAWDTALSLLQPTQLQLEHGLELHRNSLVIDSYAFAPRCAIDCNELNIAVEAGASALEIEQLREEMSMLGMLEDAQQKQAFIDAFKAAGVTCIFQNAGEESNYVEVLLRRLGRFTHAIDMMPELFLRATRPEDIVRAKQSDKHCLYLSTNGVPLPGQFRYAEEGVSFIRTFFQLGVRMMHLTYNRRNLIGDGCGEATDAGLSEFGKAVVSEMNRVGILVDIAHSGVQTGLNAVSCSEKPVVVSHAVCSALSDHVRAKPDELIRAVADKGGLIGICCMPTFLQGSGDINAFLDHIEHAVNLVGADHVAIGTDVAACLAPGSGSNCSQPLPKARKRFESLWPPRDNGRYAQWLQKHQQESLAWTNWPLYTVGLVQRGLSDGDIQKILGKNILRVAREAL